MPLNSTPALFALDHATHVKSSFIQRLANDYLLLSMGSGNKNNVLELLMCCIM